MKNLKLKLDLDEHAIKPSTACGEIEVVSVISFSAGRRYDLQNQYSDKLLYTVKYSSEFDITLNSPLIWCCTEPSIYQRK